MWSLALGHMLDRVRKEFQVATGSSLLHLVTSPGPGGRQEAIWPWLSNGASFLIQRASAEDWVSSRLWKSNQR